MNNRMDPLHFCYWLNGYVDISGNAPTIEQWSVIKEHLGLVFNKQAPSVDDYKIPESPGYTTLPFTVPKHMMFPGLSDKDYNTGAIC